jgi:cytosine/adenosine deaminase-related metal-dependent hydrolase
MSILIKNIEHGWTGDASGERISGAMRIEGTHIAEMGDLTPLPDEEVIDARGCVVTPGLVNTHHHLFQSILKGVPAGMDAYLDDWLGLVPYQFWPQIDEESLRISARIGLVELALTGATTVCDHHYVFSDRYDYDPAEVLFEEAARLGLRFVLARGGMEHGRTFDFPGTPPAPIETVRQFLDGIAHATCKWHDPSDSALTRVVCAPTTPNFNFGAGALKEIAQEARSLGLRLHAHLSENKSYASHTMRQFGQRPVPWLEGLDWLGTDVWFAHLVDLAPEEIALLAETGTAMAHCPQANARLGSGIAPASALHKSGGTVSIAVDGAGANEAADMGTALYSAFTLQRAKSGVDAIDVATVINWATMGGAKVLGLPTIGCLVPGMAADIAIFDLSAPRNFGLHDPAFAPIITGSAHARHSFVAGRQVVSNGSVIGIDLADLAEDAARITSKLTRPKETGTKRYSTGVEAVNAMKASVIAPLYMKETNQ